MDKEYCNDRLRSEVSIPRLTVLVVAIVVMVGSAANGIAVSDAPDGSRRIDLGAASRTTMVEMREVWRIAADDERVLLGMVTDAFRAVDGSIYLLDSQLQQVVRVSPGGTEVEISCRAGDGPGEVSNVYDIDSLAGGALGLCSVVPPSMAVVDADGTYVRTIKFRLAPTTGVAPQYFSILKFRPCGDGFVGAGEQTLLGGSSLVKRRFLSHFNAQGDETMCFGQQDQSIGTDDELHLSDRDSYFPVGDVWDVDGRHRICTAVDRDRYAIQVRDVGGSPVILLERSFGRHKRSEVEREQAKDNFAVSTTSGRPRVSIEIDDYDPVILGLRWLDDLLFVLSSDWLRGLPDSGIFCFDVIDPESGVWEQRCFSMPLDPRADMLIPLDARRMLRIRNLMGAFASMTAGIGVVVGEESECLQGIDVEDEMAVILYEAVE